MLSSLIRENLKKIKPYISARMLNQGGVLLDANENALGSPVSTDFRVELNRYPDPYSSVLRKRLVQDLRVPKSAIFIGNGSDEIIDLLIKLLVEPSERVLIFQPTYGLYAVRAELAGAKIVSCQLTSDFQIDFNKVRKCLKDKVKIVFCCSPNNPTGNLLQRKDIEKLCQETKGIVVVDEAYVEFSSQPSLLRKIREFPNLIIMRTFSKAWGLAGARVGYAVADPTIVRFLDRIKLPYNVSSLSARLALEALNQKEIMLQYRGQIVTERDRLQEKLNNLGFTVFPSEANFLLVMKSSAPKIANKLRKQFGIIVRDFSESRVLKNCLRISIGTPSQNRLLLKALSKII